MRNLFVYLTCGELLRRIPIQYINRDALNLAHDSLLQKFIETDDRVFECARLIILNILQGHSYRNYIRYEYKKSEIHLAMITVENAITLANWMPDVSRMNLWY